MKSGRVSPQFLMDLRLIDSTTSGGGSWETFLAELRHVDGQLFRSPAAKHVTADELSLIAQAFDKWRSRTTSVLRTKIGLLPQDDPICCPISLFAPMDFGRLEIAHTRTLAWLLDPRKEHGFGSTLLRAILERLVGKRASVSVQNIQAELIGSTGRLDLYAEGAWIDTGEMWELIIEAKIDAGEGEDQLSRYEEWAAKRGAGREVIKIFLTPSGRIPKTAQDDRILLRFSELAEIFRHALDKVRQKPGYHYLRFYIAGILKDICHWPLPIQADCADPYSVLAYLESVVHD